MSSADDAALSAGTNSILESQEEAAWSVQGALEEFALNPPTSANTPIPFFHMIQRLKTTPRAGWHRYGISHCESISDHMYRMAVITMCAPASLRDKINIQRCTTLAIVHDMAEALVGDITPVDGVSKKEKSRREATTMDFFCQNLLGGFDQGLAGKDIREAWQEYEDGETLESKFVHDVDKLELLLQMLEYEKIHKGNPDLSEFSWVVTKIETPEVKAWADELVETHKKFRKSIGNPIQAKNTGSSKPV